MAKLPNDVRVKGEEAYVVTLAEMLLTIKQQLDRIELRLLSDRKSGDV